MSPEQAVKLYKDSGLVEYVEVNAKVHALVCSSAGNSAYPNEPTIGTDGKAFGLSASGGRTTQVTRYMGQTMGGGDGKGSDGGDVLSFDLKYGELGPGKAVGIVVKDENDISVYSLLLTNNSFHMQTPDVKWQWDWPSNETVVHNITMFVQMLACNSMQFGVRYETPSHYFSTFWDPSENAKPNRIGTVLRSPDLPRYLDKTSVLLTTSTDATHVFGGWTGSVTSSNNPLSLVMDASKTITAHILPTYTLAIATNGTGCVSVLPQEDRYVSGSVVQIAATPGRGFEFANWSGDSSSTSASLSLTMDADKHLTANFRDTEAPSI